MVRSRSDTSAYKLEIIVLRFSTHCCYVNGRPLKRGPMQKKKSKMTRVDLVNNSSVKRAQRNMRERTQRTTGLNGVFHLYCEEPKIKEREREREREKRDPPHRKEKKPNLQAVLSGAEGRVSIRLISFCRETRTTVPPPFHSVLGSHIPRGREMKNLSYF